MMSVMDGSTTSKQSSRRDVGMGSRSHDFGAHLVRIESRCSVVTGSKEVNECVDIQHHGYKVKAAPVLLFHCQDVL